jgi:hypothetical protein
MSALDAAAFPLNVIARGGANPEASSSACKIATRS